MPDTPTLSRDATVRDAIQAIESSRMSLAVVVYAGGGIEGTITDGDVRRALLAGHGLDDSVTIALNREPVTAEASATGAQLQALFATHRIEAIPLTDGAGRFVRLAHVSAFRPDGEGSRPRADFAAAVIMAGGEGQRLRPITTSTPKPMIDIGGMPIIERMVRTLAHAGVPRVFIAINYQGHHIEDHFGDGAGFGVAIEYLREPEKLGTAGALSLLPERPSGPLLVVNGDILTASDYGKLLAHHRELNAAITVGAVQYQVDIPFGVLHTEGASVTGVAEKPAQRVLCNAGIYVLSPDALDLLEPARAIDMTDLIEAAVGRGDSVIAFPIHEYWSDIGTPPDLEKARRTILTTEHSSG